MAMRGAHSPEAMKLRASGTPNHGQLAARYIATRIVGLLSSLTLLRSVGTEPFALGLLAQVPGDGKTQASISVS
jgi:hypothetical protein